MPDWTYSPEYKRYRDAATGRWAARDQVQGWVTESISLADNRTRALSSMLADDLVDVRMWQTSMRSEIKQAYIDQYLAGKGGIGRMAQADWGSIGGMTAEQYRYLDKFADEVAGGKLSERVPTP